MGRRTVLLLVAALIAALGTSLVFLYVRGVDARADQRYDAVEVLMAVDTIGAGESLQEAQSAGKIEMGTVTRGQILTGVQTSTTDIGDQVALTTVYAGEQIISGKFGDPGDQEVLTIPDRKMAISVELSDPARVSGFVKPGAEVAIFVSSEKEAQTFLADAPQFTRLVLRRVTVIGVGDTTLVAKTTTTAGEDGEQTIEEIPQTLLTVAVDQNDAERVLFAAKNGEMAFALLSDKSSVDAGPGVTAKNVFE
ncbi:MAG TPA: Flp pilus assembly protein CpaB [Nocardioidaceae bacterium]|nr:Flp pilus assembly protein CpaB [Nocardioidaceae bacterium]